MRDGWRSVAFGDVARVDIERERVSPEKEYPTAGVLNAGQGMFDRGILPGRVTNYSFLHRLRAGQVVMRKLTAWEGPVTVVPSEFDRFCVSTEFPTFTLNQEYILPEFMRLICQRPSFWLALKERSTGTVQRRKRVSPSALLTVPILLPPLDQQRRIVDLITAVDAVREAALQVHALASTARQAISRALLSDDRWETVPLSRVALVNPKEPPLQEESPFAPMNAVVAGERWIRYFEPRGDRNGARG